MAAYAEGMPAPPSITSQQDSTSHAPVHCLELARKPSMRTIIPMQYPDSSEDTPSDHSSLFNAVPSRSKTTSNDSTQGSEAEKEGRRDADATESGPSGNHTGTRLFTITEQKSVPTLKTMPSNWTFQRRIFPVQPHMSSESAHG